MKSRSEAGGPRSTASSRGVRGVVVSARTYARRDWPTDCCSRMVDCVDAGEGDLNDGTEVSLLLLLLPLSSSVLLPLALLLFVFVLMVAKGREVDVEGEDGDEDGGFAVEVRGFPSSSSQSSMPPARVVTLWDGKQD